MITFEIDGEEYTAEISFEQTPDSVPFTSPDGLTYWLQAPKAV